ncbi:hypothetical protein [Nonomuraea sp. NPDC049784]|uniref:hypothetical protein n=1 Tax=Nonomuraea sp. NPDC049784 TaxID=3154361 RepID=UPI0033E9AAA4
MLDYVATHQAEPCARSGDGCRHSRVRLRARNRYFPCVAPALAHDKTLNSFNKTWLASLNGPAQLSLAF